MYCEYCGGPQDDCSCHLHDDDLDLHDVDDYLEDDLDDEAA